MSINKAWEEYRAEQERKNRRAIEESNRAAFRTLCLTRGGQEWAAYVTAMDALVTARRESREGRS